MVNIPPALEEAVKLRAKQLNRPVANYLEWLVACDLGGTTVADEPSPYQPPEKIIGGGASKEQDASDTKPGADASNLPKTKGPRRRKGLK